MPSKRTMRLRKQARRQRLRKLGLKGSPISPVARYEVEVVDGDEVMDKFEFEDAPGFVERLFADSEIDDDDLELPLEIMEPVLACLLLAHPPQQMKDNLDGASSVTVTLANADPDAGGKFTSRFSIDEAMRLVSDFLATGDDRNLTYWRTLTPLAPFFPDGVIATLTTVRQEGEIILTQREDQIP